MEVQRRGGLNFDLEGLAPINLVIETDIHRATPGGTGGVKTIGNYASVLSVAKSQGYTDVLYLDCVHKRYLEEVSSCNVFIVKGNVISTPSVKGTILPGITRKSIIDVARSLGYEDNARPTLPPRGPRANAPARATKFNPPTPAGQSNTTARAAHYKTSHAPPAAVESHSSSSCASRLVNDNDQVGTSSNQLVNVYSTSKPPQVVAIGIVTSKEPSKLVYGVHLGPEYWEVEIKKVLKPYFKLARPFANQTNFVGMENKTVAWISTCVKPSSVKTLNEAGK